MCFDRDLVLSLVALAIAPWWWTRQPLSAVEKSKTQTHHPFSRYNPWLINELLRTGKNWSLSTEQVSCPVSCTGCLASRCSAGIGGYAWPLSSGWWFRQRWMKKSVRQHTGFHVLWCARATAETQPGCDMVSQLQLVCILQKPWPGLSLMGKLIWRLISCSWRTLPACSLCNAVVIWQWIEGWFQNIIPR